MIESQLRQWSRPSVCANSWATRSVTSSVLSRHSGASQVRVVYSKRTADAKLSLLELPGDSAAPRGDTREPPAPHDLDRRVRIVLADRELEPGQLRVKGPFPESQALKDGLPRRCQAHIVRGFPGHGDRHAQGHVGHIEAHIGRSAVRVLGVRLKKRILRSDGFHRPRRRGDRKDRQDHDHAGEPKSTDPWGFHAALKRSCAGGCPSHSGDSNRVRSATSIPAFGTW